MKRDSIGRPVRIFKQIVVMSVLAFGSVYGNVHQIVVNDQSLSPASLTVTTGDTVRWLNATGLDVELSCASSIAGTSLPEGALPFEIGLPPGVDVSYRITVTGNYIYKSTTSQSVQYGEIIAVAPLPVQLTDFVATTIKNEVILDWSTSGEVNNERFEIQRHRMDVKSEGNSGIAFVTVGTINGIGNTSAVHNYKFVDKNLESGSYLYRLKQLDYNGNYVYHLLSTEVNIGIPSRFKVSGNYPNPFNPQTSFNLELPGTGDLSVRLFDVAGKDVALIYTGLTEGGYRVIDINGSSLNSGAYFCRFEFRGSQGTEVLTRRILLIK